VQAPTVDRITGWRYRGHARTVALRATWNRALALVKIRRARAKDWGKLADAAGNWHDLANCLAYIEEARRLAPQDSEYVMTEAWARTELGIATQDDAQMERAWSLWREADALGNLEAAYEAAIYAAQQKDAKHAAEFLCLAIRDRPDVVTRLLAADVDEPIVVFLRQVAWNPEVRAALHEAREKTSTPDGA